MANPEMAMLGGIDEVGSVVPTEPVQRKRGLQFRRYYTKPGIHPFDMIEWELRTAAIGNEKGETIFEQKDVEVPASWSMTATNVVVSKYFHGKMGTPDREHSVRQLVERVARSITAWGRNGSYFASEEDAETFYAELTYLLVNQYMSFNSPVWFNCGVEERPQCSACFINSVEDTMESILELARTEGRLFKWGSGTGSNLSTLRSSRGLSSGGTASGPVSFMRGYDAFAGVIKSGGKTAARRRWSSSIRNIPTYSDFIRCKSEEEKEGLVAHRCRLRRRFQCAGRGVRLRLLSERESFCPRDRQQDSCGPSSTKSWTTRAVRDGNRDLQGARPHEKNGGSGLALRRSGNAVPHDDQQLAHLFKHRPIHSSNPCSEYMFLDDTACNLASPNLMKFGRLTVSSTSNRSATPFPSRSRPRKSKSITPAIQRRKLRRTVSTTGRSASATRTSARSLWAPRP